MTLAKTIPDSDARARRAVLASLCCCVAHRLHIAFAAILTPVTPLHVRPRIEPLGFWSLVARAQQVAQAVFHGSYGF